MLTILVTALGAGSLLAGLLVLIVVGMHGWGYVVAILVMVALVAAIPGPKHRTSMDNAPDGDWLSDDED